MARVMKSRAEALHKKKNERAAEKKPRAKQPKEEACGAVVFDKPLHGRVGEGGNTTGALKRIHFDARHGKGAVGGPPAKQVVLMTPDNFFKVVDSRGLCEDRLDSVLYGLQTEVTFAPPILWLADIQREVAGRKILVHEGRHRMMAIKMLFGNILVPLQLYYDSGKAPLESATLTAENSNAWLRQAFVMPDDTNMLHVEVFQGIPDLPKPASVDEDEL